MLHGGSRLCDGTKSGEKIIGHGGGMENVAELCYRVCCHIFSITYSTILVYIMGREGKMREGEEESDKEKGRDLFKGN